MNHRGDKPEVTEKTPQQREFLILEEIKRHPRIHHNALRGIIVGRGDMAGKTFNKIVSELVRSERIVVERDLNKKRYSIPNTKINSEDFRKDIEIGASIADDQMSRLRNEYSSLYLVDKAMMAMFVLKTCANTLRVISLSSAFVRKSKQEITIEKRLQGYVREITDIVTGDSKADIVLPVLKANMLQDDAVKAMEDVLQKMPLELDDSENVSPHTSSSPKTSKASSSKSSSEIM
jgi:hypothetical protein